MPPSRGGTTAGAEVVELWEAASGSEMDPWEKSFLEHALVELFDPLTGRTYWVAVECGLCVPRQNGKGVIFEARELGGLFIFGERELVHSAHKHKTAMAGMKRLEELIAGHPDLARRVKAKGGVKRAHGDEGIYFKSGQQITFSTRTLTGGRGLHGDWVGVDEAMEYAEDAHATLLPTLSSRANPQVFYAGSAVDREAFPHGVVFSRLRALALAGGEPDLLWIEHGADIVDIDRAVAPEVASDRRHWAEANPGLGRRLTENFTAVEHRSMLPRKFAVERLGVGDWYDPDELVEPALSPDSWEACGRERSEVLDPVCFAFDVKPDRSSSSIGIAGRNRQGQLHVELVEHRPGTQWVARRLADLVAKHATIGDDKHAAIRCASRSPAAALLPAIRALDVDVDVEDIGVQAEACGLLWDAVDQGTLRHIGQAPLDAAVLSAAKRPVGDTGAFVWSRTSSTGDASPLVAVTLAARAFVAARPKRKSRPNVVVPSR